ncbi:virulence factor TspB C-terminal domain-related protein [Aeromonas hydrophila]|uniref:virulence factor TspB C-terminal domain-related protein n=1 Tax=Aeromonas hydrophila TaxID=644 RepID=UPI0002FC23F0|nr:virulence factor TspB C-terminal domain-related protein [Aeromonas hydrophila]
MITKLKAIIFALFIFQLSPVHAAYTTMTLEGVQQANGVWTAAGVVDNMGFVRTTGALTVAGTTATTAVALPVETVAASTILKNTVRSLGPVAMAGLAAYDVYNWYTSTGIKSNGTEWVVSPFGGTRLCGVRPHQYAPYGCYMYATHQTSTGCSSDFGLSSYNGTINNLTGYWCYDANLKWGDRPANQSDLDKIPLAPLSVISQGFNKLPSGTGMPVPIAGLKFQPFSVWSGDPYFKDGSWYRDRMDVSPCPTASQPTRVCVDMGPQKFEGATDPQTVPSQATGTATGSTPKENTDFCKKNPQSIACAELGELEDESLEVDERPVDVSYTPWGSSNSQCPADKIIPLWDSQSIALSYSPICQFASLLRPLVIALAFVSAGFIVAGITRKGGGEA